MTDVLHPETDKEVPRQLAVFRFLGMFHRKVDFDIGEHTCTFRRINSFELHQSGGVGTETVLFDEKRYKNAVEQAYQVIAVHTVENIVRKSKLQLAVNAVRLIE